MDKFLNLVVSGGVAGAIYSLIATGLILTYTATGVFNLGFGAVAFASAFIYYELHSGLHWPIAIAAVVTIGVFAPILGAGFDRLIFRPLAAASEAAKIVATVGVLVAVPALCLWVVEILVVDVHLGLPTGRDVYLPAGIGPTPPDTYRLGPLSLNSNQIAVFGAAAVVSCALWLLMKRTPLGLRMRAAVDRPDLARLRAVDTGRTSTYAWMIGTTLAGLAGVIGSPIFDSLDPGTYTTIMLAATAAVAIGGLRSVPLAFVGGMILGVLQDLVTGYASFARDISGFDGAVPFIVLLVALAVIGRDRSRAAGSVVDLVGDGSRRAPSLRREIVVRAAGAGLLILYLSISDRFWTTTATAGMALALVFLSYGLITGFGGLVSLAQPAFVTAAALTAGLLVDRFHLPLLLGLVAGVATATVLGLIVGLPALRLGGLQLALATLALSLVGDGVLFAWSSFSNGNNGWALKYPHLGPLDVSSPRTLGFVLLVVVLLAEGAIRRLRRSPSGRAVLAVRSSAAAAATVGVLPATARLKIFACSAGIAGLGGVFLAIDNHTAGAGTYTTTTGLVWLAAVVLWGVARPSGAIAAGMSVALLPALLAAGFHWPTWIPTFLSWNGTKSPYIPEVLFGLGAIQLASAPDGIVELLSRNVARGWRRASARDRGREVASVGTEHRSLGGAPEATLPPAGDDGLVLSVSALSAGYADAAVLSDVDLRLRPGTVTIVVGANGAGKSTLCRVLSGLLPPSAGRIVLNGADITGVPPHRRAEGGLMLIPESRGIFPGLSVDENLTIRLRTADQRAAAYQQFPGLAARRNTLAGSLSGGEQQMLSLAPALVEPPLVLLVDEPTLGLAPKVAAELIGLLSDLRSRGVTILAVEEKVHAALGIADDVVFLELGHVRWSGPRQSVDMDELASAYLGKSARGGSL